MVLVKFLLTAVVFWISGALVGTSLTHYSLRLNHPLLLAQSLTHQDDHSVLAVHDEKLARIAEQNQAGFDDRKELHAALATLTDRLNVDEAQFKTTGAVFGVLFSLFSGISTLLAILEYRNKRKSWQPPPARNRQLREDDC